MYAPKLRMMTDDERWAEGFAHRVNTAFDALLKDTMAEFEKLRAELLPPIVNPVAHKDQYEALLQGLADLGFPDERALRHQQARDMQNSYPQGAYCVGYSPRGYGFMDMLGGFGTRY